MNLSPHPSAPPFGCLGWIRALRILAYGNEVPCLIPCVLTDSDQVLSDCGNDHEQRKDEERLKQGNH